MSISISSAPWTQGRSLNVVAGLCWLLRKLGNKSYYSRCGPRLPGNLDAPAYSWHKLGKKLMVFRIFTQHQTTCLNFRSNA